MFYIPDKINTGEDFRLIDKNNNISDSENIIEEFFNKQESENISLNTNYSYRNSAQNPFTDYLANDVNVESRTEDSSEIKEQNRENNSEKQNKDITPAEVKEKIPFKLKGIIDTGDNRIAIIVDNNTSILLEIGDRYDDFIIYKIKRDKVLIKYKDIIVDMEISN